MKLKMKMLMAMIAFLAPLLCTSFSSMAADPSHAYELMEEGKAVIVDVREEEEQRAGMIRGAMGYPLSRFTSSSDWVRPFRDLSQEKVVFLYCRTGRRSAMVKSILHDRGIAAENLGGYEELQHILPVMKPETP